MAVSTQRSPVQSYKGGNISITKDFHNGRVISRNGSPVRYTLCVSAIFTKETTFMIVIKSSSRIVVTL